MKNVLLIVNFQENFLSFWLHGMNWQIERNYAQSSQIVCEMDVLLQGIPLPRMLQGALDQWRCKSFHFCGPEL